MANEAHDPWALLAAARGSVLQHKERLLDCDHEDDCTCDLAAQKIVLLDRIDAALEEHADSAQSAVEWIDYGEWGAKSTQIDGFALTVRAHGLPGPWHWEAPRCSGYAATKDEAKSAAIAAARGMR